MEKMTNRINTFLDVLADYQTRHNFGKKIGVLSKSALILGLSKHLEQPGLKKHLKECENMFQVIQVIQTKTQELKIKRTPLQIKEFETQLKRLIKMARL